MKPLNVRELTQEECRTLDRWRHARTVSAGLRQRSTMVGIGSRGGLAAIIAEQVQVDEAIVRRWMERFNDEGIERMKERPRSGRSAVYSQEEVSLAVQAAGTRQLLMDHV